MLLQLTGRVRRADASDHTRNWLCGRPRFSLTLLSLHVLVDVPSLVITAMSDVTRNLEEIQQGDPHAAERLLPLVYDELRRLAGQRLAHEKPGQTLQATALVHEAYVRLVDAKEAQHWDSRGHFFAAAAEAM